MQNKVLNNLGWIGLAVLSLVPAVFWFLQAPLAFRFGNLGLLARSAGDLAGLVGMAMFALALILSARLKFLEKFFRGINDSYAAHHYFGAMAFCLLLFHPLFFIYDFIAISFGDWALNLGKIGLLLMIIALVITFYTKLKYQVWKFTHKFLGLAFIFGFFHAFLIGSDIASNRALKIYLLVLGILAILAYFYRSLFSYFFVPSYKYTVNNIKTLPDQTWEIEFHPQAKAMNFSAGQFAFVKLYSNSVSKEPHPFTMSSAPGQSLKFAIKDLGDYTKNLAGLKAGDRAVVEGPFGVFDFRKYVNKNQIWIAGGIGVTPFLSMVRSLTPKDADYKIDLYYSCKNENLFALKEQLEEAVKGHKNINLHFWNTDKDGFITAENIKNAGGCDIFICGPNPMMQSLKQQFIKQSLAKTRIHMEEFQLY